jgi:hypothetical protein
METLRRKLEAKLRGAGLEVHPFYVADSLLCYEEDPDRYPSGLDSLVALERERQWSEAHALKATDEERDAHDRRVAEALGLPYTPIKRLTPEERLVVQARVRATVLKMKAAKQEK